MLFLYCLFFLTFKLYITLPFLSYPYPIHMHFDQPNFNMTIDKILALVCLHLSPMRSLPTPSSCQIYYSSSYNMYSSRKFHQTWALFVLLSEVFWIQRCTQTDIQVKFVWKYCCWTVFSKEPYLHYASHRRVIIT